MIHLNLRSYPSKKVKFWIMFLQMENRIIEGLLKKLKVNSKFLIKRTLIYILFVISMVSCLNFLKL